MIPAVCPHQSVQLCWWLVKTGTVSLLLNNDHACHWWKSAVSQKKIALLLVRFRSRHNLLIAQTQCFLPADYKLTRRWKGIQGSLQADRLFHYLLNLWPTSWGWERESRERKKCSVNHTHHQSINSKHITWQYVTIMDSGKNNFTGRAHGQNAFRFFCSWSHGASQCNDGKTDQ